MEYLGTTSEISLNSIMYLPLSYPIFALEMISSFSISTKVRGFSTSSSSYWALRERKQIQLWILCGRAIQKANLADPICLVWFTLLLWFWGGAKSLSSHRRSSLFYKQKVSQYDLTMARRESCVVERQKIRKLFMKICDWLLVCTHPLGH